MNIAEEEQRYHCLIAIEGGFKSQKNENCNNKSPMLC